jgi:hypothetical protein
MASSQHDDALGKNRSEKGELGVALNRCKRSCRRQSSK